MSVVTVYAVFADGEEARRIGRTVVEERLAACVNILAPCASIYWWEGEVTQSDEVPALFKTTTDRADALIERIEEVHGYDKPAIVAWPIERLAARYGQWVESELR